MNRITMPRMKAMSAAATLAPPAMAMPPAAPEPGHPKAEAWQYRHSPRQVTQLDRCLAARVRAARLYRCMSQTEVADHLGVSFQQVQKYESGANRMSVSTFVVIAEALGVPPTLLLERALEDMAAGGRPGLADLPEARADHGRAEQTTALLEGFARLATPKLRQQVLVFLALLARDMEAKDHMQGGMAVD